MSHGNGQKSPVTGWPVTGQFDLAAYIQQLSYPQLLTAGRARPGRGVLAGVGGLVHAVRGIGRDRAVARGRV